MPKTQVFLGEETLPKPKRIPFPEEGRRILATAIRESGWDAGSISASIDVLHPKKHTRLISQVAKGNLQSISSHRRRSFAQIATRFGLSYRELLGLPIAP